MRRSGIFTTYKIFTYLLAKYVLAFLILAITQIVFFFVNEALFSIDGPKDALMILLGNIHFGISTTAIVLVPYFLLNVIPIGLRWKPIYKNISETIYIISVSVMMVANLADTIYFQWTLRRTTGDIFNYLTVGGDMGNLVPQFLDVCCWICCAADSIYCIVQTDSFAASQGLSQVDT